MPDSGGDNKELLFEGKFDAAAIIKGVDALIDSVANLEGKEAALEKQLKETTNELEKNRKSLQDVHLAQQSADKSASDYESKMKALARQADDLRAKNNALNETVKKQEALIGSTSKTISDLKAKYEQASSAAKKLEATTGGIEKTVSGTKLSGYISKVASMAGVASLAATAVTATVAAIVELINKETEAEIQQNIINEGLKGYAHGVAEATVLVEDMTQKIHLAKDGRISEKKVIDEYNKTIGQTLGVTNDINIAEERLIKNGPAFIKMMGLKARMTALQNLEIAELEKQLKGELNVEDKRNDVTKFFDYIGPVIDMDVAYGDISKKQEANKKRSVKRFNTNIAEESKAKVDIIRKDKDKTRDLLFKEAEAIGDIQTELPKPGKSANSPNKGKPPKHKSLIENLYDEELLAIRQMAVKYEEQTATKILDSIEATYDKIKLRLENEFKKKQLTKVQFDELIGLNELGRKSAISSSIDEHIEKSLTKNLKNFEWKPFAKRVKAVAEFYENEVIKEFQRINEKIQNDSDFKELNLLIGSKDDIAKQTELYLSGKINYEEYQKELTKIAKAESRKRKEIELEEVDAALRAIRRQEMDVRKMSDDDIAAMEDKKIGLKKRKTKLETEIIVAQTEGGGDGNTGSTNKGKEKIDKIAAYASAANEIIQSVVSAWSAANEAEQRSLDRSIAIQEKRVDAARRIAERGNAEYLRLEEDRQRDLEVKRENAARKQLALNAIMQGSQIITALISGVAQGVSVGGPVGAIIGLAAVAAAIGGAIAISESLKPQVPSFFKGIEDTGRGNADNKGGFYAVLHPNERVVPAEENKKLKGVSNEKLAHFVAAGKWYAENHPVTQPPLMINMENFDKAIQMSGTFANDKLASLLSENNKKLEENNTLQKETNEILGNLGFSVNVDKNGLAIAVADAIKRREIDKRA